MDGDASDELFAISRLLLRPHWAAHLAGQVSRCWGLWLCLHLVAHHVVTWYREEVPEAARGQEPLIPL